MPIRHTSAFSPLASQASETGSFNPEVVVGVTVKDMTWGSEALGFGVICDDGSPVGDARPGDAVGASAVGTAEEEGEGLDSRVGATTGVGVKMARVGWLPQPIALDRKNKNEIFIKRFNFVASGSHGHPDVL